MLLITILLMGLILSGGVTAYHSLPFLNENPQTSLIVGVVLLVLILWIFPKIIGLVIKFAIFCVIVFFICRLTGIDFDFLKTSKGVVEKLENKAEEITEAVDKVKMIAEPNKTFTARPTQIASGREVQFNSENIVLYGIDTPDTAQSCKNRNGTDYSCGQVSKNQLQSLTFGQELSCDIKGTNLKGQKVASCTNVNGDDIASLMVRSGWAIADRTQTEKYVSEEMHAYKQKVGLWEGKFKEPEKWRRSNKSSKRPSETQQKNKKQTPYQKLKAFFSK